MINLRGLFTVEALVANLKALPVLKTPIMDSIFTDRPQLGLPLIGSDIIEEAVHALPLVRRGGASISMPGPKGGISYYEPLPVRPDKDVTAADLNNLKALKKDGLDAWVRERTDLLRRAVRKTTEGLCAQALTGKINWPIQLEGGAFERWTIDFGDPLGVNVAKKWGDAANTKIADVFETLQSMHEALEEQGHGGEVEIQAASDAYNALFVLAESFKSTAKIRVEITDQGINIGGYLVRRRGEKYRDPETKQMTPVVPAKTVRMVAKDAGHKLVYAAIDDLDANLLPLPFFIKPLKIDNPSGWKLIADAKPFPVANPRGVCTAQVLA